MNDFITNVIRAIDRDNEQPGDYRDSKGFLLCGHCHTRKEKEVPWGKVHCICKCIEEELEAEKAELKALAHRDCVEKLRKACFPSASYHSFLFEKNTRGNYPAYQEATKYVKHFEAMKRDNIGILFMGGVGTGKTFLAGCIANALLEREVRVFVTTFPVLLREIGTFGKDAESLLKQIERCDLLVIDDLGIERNTEFANETVFEIVDTRYRAGKPLIITTNLSPSELKNASTIAKQRIYDRIIGMCCKPIILDGSSLRIESAKKRRNAAEKIMRL